MHSTFTAIGFFRNIYLFAFTLAHFLKKNSFFPVFLLLYVFQFFLLPVAMYPSFFSTLFINLLYVVAFSYYLHITFLGFNGICFPFASFFPLLFTNSYSSTPISSQHGFLHLPHWLGYFCLHSLTIFQFQLLCVCNESVLWEIIGFSSVL